MKRTFQTLFCTLLIVCLIAPSASANVANLPRTDQPVKIDGVLDDIAWQHATQIEIDTETNPGENIPARVSTIAYLVEDGEKLYVAFDARDPNPAAIRAYLQDRDSAWNDDFVGIVLDTYNDERRAFEFFSNPLGVQMDLTNDDVNENEDSSWDAIWDSAGAIHDEGYIVEMEIPLSQLRFPSAAGKQTWGIDLLRFYPRDKRYRFSNNRLDRSRNCYLCQFGKIEGLEGAQPGRDLEIVPTLTASRTDSTDDPGIEPLRGGNTDTDAGVSIRWGITPDMTANLAINPDFSQVEADVAQLEVNNQFALFFPEKRPFFLEGADYFSTPINAVFTRTVADPDVGAKLTGKRGNHTYGVFAAEDSITNLLFPGAFGSDSTSLDDSNTAFVGRYSRGFGDASSIGALLTSRSGDDYHNHVGGLDLHWKINDQHSVFAQYMRSDTEYPDDVASEFEQPTGSFSGNGISAGYEYESRNWFAYIDHEEYSANFRADAGFVPQVDASQQVIGLGRIWHGEEGDWWTRMRLNGDWDITHDDRGEMLEREIEAYFGIGGPMQSWVQIGGLSRDTLWDGALFREDKISFYVEAKPVSGLELGVWTRYGDQVDFANSRLGDQLRIAPFVEWNVNRHLFLELDATLLQLDTKDGEQIFDAGVYDLRLTWQFSRRTFLRLTTQLTDIDRNQAVYVDDVDANFRRMGRQLLYSYKINPQTVFFLGYSDNLVDDDDLRSLEETDRTWFMKVGYAWTP
ncbi:MAG: carbohydrate binding family 9 domain-containing protein [Gammaproteobacteria bacterium]|nr:carbohydrate binding family 9 domain-containing protein [Gammaproteobacteria bacterium]